MTVIPAMNATARESDQLADDISIAAAAGETISAITTRSNPPTIARRVSPAMSLRVSQESAGTDKHVSRYERAASSTLSEIIRTGRRVPSTSRSGAAAVIVLGGGVTIESLG